ncbi:general alpha-glucoside permease [Thozetella sp. PMI_491]|nr:general alpha-glucoside permease [Thozetella sp. PMI_491]
MADKGHAPVAANPETTGRASVTNPKFDPIAAEAERATAAEQNTGLWASVKLYPKAVGWSILLSTAIVMEGFDLVLLGSLLAYPPFQKKFGEPVGDGTYQISADWQTGLNMGAQVGEILGLFAVGVIAERVGYRMTLIAALALVACFIFIVFFAQSLPQLLVGEILLGIPWGAFQTLTTTFAAEVCPVNLRAYLTSYVNLCWVFGQLIASGVMRAMVDRDDEIGFRIPFGLQWIWPIPLIVGIYLAPESPWWLIRKDRLEDAKRSLLRLTSLNADPNFNADETISMMIHTNELERSVTAGTSYWDCFKGTNLRRTEITVVVETIPQICGTALQAYSTYFYEQAGMSVANAFTMSMAQYAIGAVGTLLAWFMMSVAGRRTVYLGGLTALAIFLLVIGCVALVPRDNVSAQWAIGTMLLLHTFTYDATVGPVSYSLVTELSSTRLKNKSVVLARNVYNIAGIIVSVLAPRMLNPTAWNWGAKTGFFWAGLCLLSLTWGYFRLPEPKGRTYAELDILFEKKISARKFASTVIETLGVDNLDDEKLKAEEVEAVGATTRA